MEFVILTGLSGAGKTRAMHAMEDIGFFCVDNLPPALIPVFYDLCLKTEGTQNRAAVVTDTRGGELFKSFFTALESLKRDKKPYKILFLDSSDSVLVNRFQETRRKHPLSDEMGGALEQAVKLEREMLKPVKECSDYVIDTSGVSPAQLKARITEMGAELYEQFHGKNPLFLGGLKGSFVFMADLVRACQVKSDVEFIAVSSYQNATVSSGRVQITHDLQQDITGRHLIIVEDILDSGNTLAFLKDYFMTKGAASITIVTLLDKPSRRTKAITADLAGFVVPDEFVVGYGLDYCQQYRNVPYIGVLKPEVYSGE